MFILVEQKALLMTKEAWIHRQKARGRDRFKRKTSRSFHEREYMDSYIQYPA